ncbi:MAG: phage tail terminator-like protein [Ilumatobacteraceae bacterium]
MSSTYNDLRAAIEGRIAAELAKAPTYPVSYQNVPFTPPNNTPWLQAFIRFGDNAYATLLPTGGVGFNRQNGTLVVNVFTPIGAGTAANFTIAERVKDLFDRAKFSSIIFDPASGPAQVTPAAPEPYYQTQLTATFEAYVD